MYCDVWTLTRVVKQLQFSWVQAQGKDHAWINVCYVSGFGLCNEAVTTWDLTTSELNIFQNVSHLN